MTRRRSSLLTDAGPWGVAGRVGDSSNITRLSSARGCGEVAELVECGGLENRFRGLSL